jgi:hypothetical protein
MHLRASSSSLSWVMEGGPSSEIQRIVGQSAVSVRKFDQNWNLVEWVAPTTGHLVYLADANEWRRGTVAASDVRGGAGLGLPRSYVLATGV